MSTRFPLRLACLLALSLAGSARAQTLVFTNYTTANGLPVNNVADVFASGSTVYAATFLGASISLDNGLNWTTYTTANGMGSNSVNAVYASGSTVYAALFNGGLSTSTNGGALWTNFTTANGLGSNYVNGVYVEGSTIYAATGFGLGISTNGGTTWTNYTTSNGLVDNVVKDVYAIGGSRIYAATRAGLSISTNGGTNWTNYTTTNGLGSNSLGGVFASGSTIYVATDNGLSISTNDGGTWTNYTVLNGLPDNLVFGVFASGSSIYAATQNGLGVSTSGGSSWTTYNSGNGLGGQQAQSVYAVGSTVYVGTTGGLSIATLVKTYTNAFSGTIPSGNTAILDNGASVAGNVVNNGTLVFNMSGSSAVANNAVISGTGAVWMTGSGTVSNLFDAQTYTGGTRLENGTLLINYNDRLGNTSSGVTFDGGRLQITNSGVVSTFSTARSISLVSTGTIDTSTLANGSYDQPAFTGVVSGTGALTLAAHGLGNGASDAYLRFGGASTYTGTTRITSGMVYASSTAAFGTSTVVLDGGGLVAPNAVTVNNAIVLAGTANFVRPWTSQTMNLGGVISGTGGLQKSDNGTVNLNTANTYTGTTRILAGTLNAANYAALAETTLDMNSADAGSIGFTVAQTGTYQIGGLTGSRAINNGGDTLAIGGNDASTTYSGTLTGAGALVKTGIGTLTLTGNNSYSGGTVLQGGTLALGSAGAIGSVGTISFIGGTLQYSASNTTDYSARLSNAAGQNYVIDTNGYNVAFGATLTAAGGSLTKLGSGTLSLPKDEDSDYLGLKNMSLEVVAGVVSGPGTPDFYVTAGNRFNVSGGRFEGVTTTQIGSPGALATGTISGGVVVTNIQVGSTFFGPAGGHFTFSGGRLDGNLTVGLGSNTTASSVVTGGTVGGATAVHVIGVSGTGTLTMSGGLLQGSEFVIGSAAASTGTVTVSGGTLAMSGSLLVADGGNGSLSIADAGVVSVGGGSNDLQLGGLSSGAGILNIGTGGVAGTLTASHVFRRPGTGNATVNFNHTGTTTFSPALAGAMTVNKLGSGTTNLTAASTFTGTATVSAGELKVNGSLGVASLVNVLSGGALSGTGTIAGATTIAGVHAPGNSPGVQTFTGDLTYLVGAAVEWELAANTASGAGTNFDQVAMPTGNLTFSGSTTLALSFNGAGSTVVWSDTFWDSNRAWTIYDLGTGTTTGFSNLVLGGSLLDSLGNALEATRGAFSTSLVGQDVVLNYTVAAVPEPATLVLALAGLAGGGCMLRRRRRA